jgi:hypothetical protein
VLRVPGGYRMWYEAFDGRVFRILSARSSDGLAWTKEGVALEPGAAGGLDALGARRPSVVQRAQRYELWYEGLAEDQARYHVLRAVSTDLASWAKLPGEIDLWSGRMADAENVAGAVLVNADGSCRVFFSSRRTRVPPRMARPGPRVDFSIYAVTVKP